MSIRTTIVLFSFALGLGFTSLGEAASLPVGNSGIAAKYPGDSGIGSDPAVIFADDFESYGNASELIGKWSEVTHPANMRIATEPDNVFSGRHALEFTVPQTSSEISNNAVKYLSPAREVLFLRYYAKFDEAYNVLGSSHNGISISSHYCCPGVRADGYNKFFVSFEAGREQTGTANPGKLNLYVYYPDQRDVWGDHIFPTGIVVPFTRVPYDFGGEFVAHRDFVPMLGRWYSYELMVKPNTPGQRDGRIAFWIDGQLLADFPNIRLRETPVLKIDRFSVDFHVRSNSLGIAKKWIDNVVAATSYIGPMAPSVPLPVPTGLRIVQ
jgi:hypothetical protein